MADAVDGRDRIARELEAMAAARGAGRTFCPSEVARRLDSEWRAWMPAVRAVAGDLVDAGRLAATQRGRRADPRTARGPIRLGLPPPA